MRTGEWVTLLGLAALLAGSLLPWYDVPVATDISSLGELVPDAVLQAANVVAEANMWDLNVLRWVGLIALFCAAMLLLATWFGETAGTATLWSVPAAWFGLLLTVMIGIRVFDAPFDGAANRYGIYVSLAGAVLVWQGAWESMRDERTPPALDHSPEPELITRRQVDEHAG